MNYTEHVQEWINANGLKIEHQIKILDELTVALEEKKEEAKVLKQEIDIAQAELNETAKGYGYACKHGEVPQEQEEMF